MRLKAKSIIKIAQWLTPGTLYAGRIVQVRDNPFIRDGEEIMYCQGGTGGQPPGDPLTIWKRAAGQQTFQPALGVVRSVVVAPGMASLVSTLHPWTTNADFIGKYPESRIGSVASPAVYYDGYHWHMWYSATVGASPTAEGGYQRQFTVRHAISDDMVTFTRVPYDRNHQNFAVRDAALWWGEFVAADRYPSERGVLVTGGALLTEPTNATRYLYLMLSIVMDVGAKNALVRLNVDDRNADFEVWQHDVRDALDRVTSSVWVRVANGELPNWLTRSDWGVANPYQWPINYIGETPVWLLGRAGEVLGKTRFPRFMAVSGFSEVKDGKQQKDERQLVVMFSDTLTSWDNYTPVEFPDGYEGIANLNYRSYYAGGQSHSLTFASNDAGLLAGGLPTGKQIGTNPSGDQAMFELVLEPFE